MSKIGLLVLCLLAGALPAGVVIPVEVKSGGWEFVARADAQEHTGPDCWHENWKPLAKIEGKALIRWFAPAAHAKHGRPISLRVLIGEDNGWYRDAAKARLWLSGRGEGQRGFQIICAPDVTQLIDPNPEPYALWLAVEYQDGAKLPFYGAGYPSLEVLTEGNSKGAPDWCIRVPQGYDISGKPARAGNAPLSLGAGQTRIVQRDQAAIFSGKVWTWSKWIGVEKGEGPALVSWAAAPAQPDAGKVVKYIVYFGKTDAPPFNDDPAQVKAWFECKGQGQWEWFMECAPDVTQILDTNKEGKYRLWVAVEFENGKRCGYQGANCPKVVPFTESMRSLVDRTAAKLPAGYTAATPDKMDIRGRLGVYLKAGRQWTTRITSKVVNAGENVSHARTEILNVGDDFVEYQYTELDGAAKPIAGVEPQKLKLQLLVPRPKDAVVEPAAVEETITVKAGTFDCLRTVSEGMGVKTITWTSKRFSGLVVKQILTGETNEQIQELVEFKE